VLKFEDGSIKNFLVEDPSGHTKLSAVITTAKHCTRCWTNTDIVSAGGWDAKINYTDEELSGRSMATPDSAFVLNPSTDQCELACGEGFWANIHSRHNKAASEYDQRCISHNCKSWDPTDAKGAPQNCTTCWEKTDLDWTSENLTRYNSWDAAPSYALLDIYGMDQSNPFT
jgi:hypothetical protein